MVRSPLVTGKIPRSRTTHQRGGRCVADRFLPYLRSPTIASSLGRQDELPISRVLSLWPPSGSPVRPRSAGRLGALGAERDDDLDLGLVVAPSIVCALDSPNLGDDVYADIFDWSQDSGWLAVALGEHVYFAGGERFTQRKRGPSFLDQVTALTWQRSTRSGASGHSGLGAAPPDILAVAHGSRGLIEIVDVSAESPRHIVSSALHDREPASRVASLAWSTSCSLLAAARFDGSVALYDVRMAQPTVMMMTRGRLGHSTGPACVVRWNDAHTTGNVPLLASGGSDHSILLHDLRGAALSPMKRIDVSTPTVLALAWCPSSGPPRLASGTGHRDGRVSVHEIVGSDVSLVCEAKTQTQVTSLAFSPMCESMVLSSTESQVMLWQHRRSRLVSIASFETCGRALRLAVDPSGQFVAWYGVYTCSYLTVVA